MPGDADIATIGRLLGDDHRASYLLALLGESELPAGELAARAGASPSLTSGHLAKLVDGGLLVATRRGRQRLFRLATPEVAHAVEALLAIAPTRPVTGLRDATTGEAIRRARTCYDHFAGRLGVTLVDSFEVRDLLTRDDDGGWALTAAGAETFATLGIDLAGLRSQRRRLIRGCLDWTERRPHLAGGLGAAVASRMFELRWVTRLPASRAVRLTPVGEAELRARFAVEL